MTDTRSAKPLTYAGYAVHLALRNTKTGRIGDAETPAADLVTACGEGWTDDARPRRTLNYGLVTCPWCLLWIRGLNA